MIAIDSINRENNKNKGGENFPGNIPWSPKKVSEVPGEYDLVENSCRISIPATAAGAILGMYAYVSIVLSIKSVVSDL